MMEKLEVGQVCFNCGKDSIGCSTIGSPLELCGDHFNLAMIAGWKPVLHTRAGAKLEGRGGMSTFEQAAKIVGLAEIIIEALKHYPQDIQVAALKCVMLVPGLEKEKKK